LVAKTKKNAEQARVTRERKRMLQDAMEEMLKRTAEALSEANAALNAVGKAAIDVTVSIG
jgi:hypothetical protein